MKTKTGKTDTLSTMLAFHQARLASGRTASEAEWDQLKAELEKTREELASDARNLTLAAGLPLERW